MTEYKRHNDAINSIVDEIKEYEMLEKEIKEKIDKAKQSLKDMMVADNVDELKTDRYIVRYKEVTSNRFDTTKFKKEHADVYNAYLVESVTKRFSIK